MQSERPSGAFAHASLSSSSSASSLHRVNALDARLNALRDEARTGLASNEVRRTLIKEQLRPPPLRPTPTPPPSQSLRVGQVHTSVNAVSGIPSSLCTPNGAASGSKRQPSTWVETTIGGDNDVALPPAWVTGDFQLDSPLETTSSASSFPQEGIVTTSTCAGAVAACTPLCLKEAKIRPTDVTSHATYANTLRAYEALCRVANDVVYDLSYEEGLRRVESRDSHTGLATSWITRRSSATLLSSNAALFTNVGWSKRLLQPEEEKHVGSSRAASQAQHKNTFPVSLYMPPPSRSSARSLRSVGSDRQSRKDSNVKPALSNTCAATSSFVGTAVVRSSAAHYVMALRQLVKAQREQSAVADPRGQLTAPSASVGVSPSSTIFHGNGFECEFAGETEWCTRVVTAVAIAVCPSCDAMFSYTLTSKSMPYGENSEEGETRQREKGKGLGRSALASATVCPRCGHTINFSTDTTAAADAAVNSAAALCPWMLPPPPATPFPSTLLAKAYAPPGSTLKEDIGKQSNPHASKTSGCGTDSVGFAAKDGEESFAALIARIRASRKDEAVSDTKRAFTRVAASTFTGMNPAEVRTDATHQVHQQTRAPVGSEKTTSAPCQSSSTVALSVLSAPASVDPMASRLRTALSHLYFFELLQGGRKKVEKA